MVQTLGGVIGDIGQMAEGEAAFVKREPSIVFLASRASRGAAMAVVGRAQGQLVVTMKDHREVVRVRSTGALVQRRFEGPRRPPGRPVVELDGAPLHVVAQDAARAWEASHGR